MERVSLMLIDFLNPFKNCGLIIKAVILIKSLWISNKGIMQFWWFIVASICLTLLLGIANWFPKQELIRIVKI